MSGTARSTVWVVTDIFLFQRSLLFHNTVCFWFGVKSSVSSTLCPREQCLQPRWPMGWGLPSETGLWVPSFQQFCSVKLSFPGRKIRKTGSFQAR